ncbi:hypothetical protein E8E13_003513 [Curvularia kusanoi]|uniref:Heterokaryon incompatibility domain-containing protein n=1 Tax=Curvularia kusanoi TaxID=90978 RepID=A0A9P4TFC7_CURKU|nr:hypothetical protein E8E13_003513 [Curvularia kusanoi]
MADHPPGSAQGYIDPNWPPPGGDGDATIIIYGYTPNFALCVLALVLFSILGLAHGWQLSKYRTWYFSTTMIGIVFEIIGYIARTLSAKRDPYRVAYFVIQYFFVVVAPVFFAAAIYTVLSVLIRATPDGPRHAPLRPKLILWIFITCDVVATIVQIVGAALIGVAYSNRRDPTNPNHILLAGLVFQAVTFLLFIVLLTLFVWRARDVVFTVAERRFYASLLCIIQDDPEDKMHQIMAMNNIYNAASLVLVVAHGDSMDFGIPGISRPRPKTQLQEDIDGLRLTNLVQEQRGSPLALWQTRAWTYQEAVCARRLIRFTNTQVHYQCQVLTYHEDMYRGTLDIDGEKWRACVLYQDHEQSKFDALKRHLDNYTSRKLSFPSDVYNAFMGIANLLYESDYSESFLYGLPRTDFGRALLWFAWDGTKPTPRVDTPDLICPSWSWASAMVHGEKVAYRETTYYGPLAAWITEIQDSEWPEATGDEGWQEYMKPAEQEDCVVYSPNQELLQDMDGSILQEKVTYQSPTQNISTTRRIAYRDYTPELDEAKPGYLVVLAQVASFKLGQSRSVGWGLDIIDSANKEAGELSGGFAYFRKTALAPESRGIDYENRKNRENEKQKGIEMVMVEC